MKIINARVQGYRGLQDILVSDRHRKDCPKTS